MTFEELHHVKTKDLTEELYHKFCKNIKGQGFGDGEYPYDNWIDYKHVGIFNGRIYHGGDLVFDEPDKLLTIGQALSTQGEQQMSRVRIIEIEQEPKFKPFKLEITIESEEDLINLLVRMDLTNTNIEDSYKFSTAELKLSKTSWKNSIINEEAWRKLDEKVMDLKLRK